jgi:hypothetical protein
VRAPSECNRRDEKQDLGRHVPLVRVSPIMAGVAGPSGPLRTSLVA